MRAQRVPRDKQLELIMQCRASGMSDYQWCRQNEILPGTFYNWISKLRKQGVAIPDSETSVSYNASRQEVVKLDVVSGYQSSVMEQNTSYLASPVSITKPSIDIKIGNNEIHVYNDTNPELLRVVLQSLGGDVRAW